ncbi:MAG: hypothetical protein E6Q71_04080 [Pseudomonas sp.]|nr:MAG: hypothetical protein E6Q71_04080 [Pseudomonas sp.]
MSYSFKVDTTRERLIEALETVAIIEAPSAHTADQVAVARDRMMSHAKEIEAVCMTLRVQGVRQDQFLDYLPGMTPEHVMVEIYQAGPGAEVEARQYRSPIAH